jgi:hypothetical protein
MAKYSSSGWHGQITRHSNARKTGHAGGTYAGWRTMTSAQRHNAKQDRIMDYWHQGLKEKDNLSQKKYNKPYDELSDNKKKKIDYLHSDLKDSDNEPTNKSETLKLSYLGKDDWGRKTYVDLNNKERFYKKVDGILHTVTDKGEPDIPIKRPAIINKETTKNDFYKKTEGAFLNKEDYKKSLNKTLAERTSDHDSEKKISAPLKKEIAYIPAPPIKEANNLPVQVSIIVPSTKQKNKNIGEKEFKKRVDETKKELDKIFGADTSVQTLGSYFDGKELIEETGAKIESSTTIPKYKKNIKKIVNFTEDKRKKWGQDTMALQIEGRLFVVPKKGFIDDDKKTKNKPIPVT